MKGMDPVNPTYNAMNPSMPATMPLQPQSFPAPPQTAIVPYMAEIPGVTPGLEYLTQIDQVVVNEKFSSGQSWGRNYEMANNLGQRIFTGKQEIVCCGALYNLHISDNNSKEVMQLLQPCQCTCSPNLEIHCPPGNIIGYSLWNWSAFVTSLSIQNATKQTVLVVVGPGFQTNLFGDVNFEVKSNDETQTVGMIRRESGHFTVQFPFDLDVNIKAVLIGSCFFLMFLDYNSHQPLPAQSMENDHGRHSQKHLENHRLQTQATGSGHLPAENEDDATQKKPSLDPSLDQSQTANKRTEKVVIYYKLKTP